MKTILRLACILLCLSSCVDNSDINGEKLIEKETNKSFELEEDKDFEINEFGDLKASPEGMKVLPAGAQLTYNSTNGTWYGALEGVSVRFYGPTPSQLQSGMQSVWQNAPGGPICSGCLFYGDGDYFTVQQPGCMPGYTKYVTMAKRKESISGTGIVVWSSVTRVATQTGDGTWCKFIYNGKIVIDEQCKPVIVTTDSDSNNSCSSGLIPL